MNERMSKLALFGGPSALPHRVGYGHQVVSEEDVLAVEEVLRSDWLTCGPATDRFEEGLRDVTKSPHVTAVANGTAALHVACLAAGVSPGDEVVVSSLTFAASSNCALYCGARPVFADVDPRTWNVTAETVEAAMTPRTKAVVAVDFGGVPVDASGIRRVCADSGVAFIEDAAHSIGGFHSDGSPVGSAADLTCFSFHPVKTVTSGEGGAVSCSNFGLAKGVELYARHGITRRPEWMEEPDAGGWHYEQIALGYNYRISDLEAALGASQLRSLPEFVGRRREITARYDEAFAGMPEVTPQHDPSPSLTARHLYCVRFDLDALEVDRRFVYDALAAEGVGVNVHYLPVYLLPYYQSLGYKRGLCPNAEAYYGQAVTLPLHCAMSDEDVEGVIRAVEKVVLWCVERSS